MSTRLSYLFVALSSLALSAGCGGDSKPGETPDASVPIDAAPDSTPVPSEISEFLETIPGLTFTEETTVYDGYRRFALTYTQPVDHEDPLARTFTQRAMLHHASRPRPFVLYTSGYYLFSEDNLSELAGSMGANQLDVEQRFFAPSIPTPTSGADWQYARIEQAAADHHRFVTALKPYYTAAWLSTGHSKGGMTSVYHRRFYPDDVDATVAYVAPISFAAGDTRYHTFFDQVADANCRQALRDVQRQMLGRHAELLTRLQALIEGTAVTFDRLGGIDSALEDAIVGMPWGFFQSGTSADCVNIPGAGASDDALFAFVRNHISSDSGIDTFSPYYYQAEAELGYPSIPTAHLEDLLQFQDVTGDFLPVGATATYDPNAMVDVDQWVKSDGAEILFVYGEYDPWFGGAFALGAQTSDSFKLVVAGANHGALIRRLALADREVALSAVERWTGVRPSLSRSARLAKPPELPTVRIRMRLR